MKREQIEKFCKKYPALKKEVFAQYPLLEGEPILEPDIYINVQRMDENLFYFKGQAISGKESCLFRKHDGTGLDQNGSCFEKVYVINHHHEIIARKLWRVREIGLIRTVKDLILSVSPVSQIAYIIKVVSCKWYKPVLNTTPPFGKLEMCETDITIYNPPKRYNGSIQGLLHKAVLDQHVILDTKRLTRGVLDKEPEFLALQRNLDKLAQSFVDEVYNRGLRSRIDKSKCKGMSGTFDETKMMTFVMCGRVRIIMEQGDNQITLQGNEDGAPCMYVCSINATFPSAQNIIYAVIAEFEDELKMSYRNLNDDQKISVM